jgi:hypothetical protein
MSDLWLGIWIGFLLGIVAGFVVSYVWELRERLRLYKDSEKLVGSWTAFNVVGRNIEKTPMRGVGLTVVTRKGDGSGHEPVFSMSRRRILMKQINR